MAKKRPAKPKVRARKAAPRKKQVEAIPKRYGVLVPSLTVRGCADALAFYAKAFGAKELGGRAQGPDGRIMHAEFRIGDRVVMIADEFPEMGSKSPQALGGSPASLLLYVKDVDAAFRRAVDAGAKVTMPLEDQFWGDRYGRVVDPFGHDWQLATHKEDVSPKEMMRRMAALPPPPGAGG
ncbi:MAG: VOC family protein [Anaeromyxobacteraceae bacterium]